MISAEKEHLHCRKQFVESEIRKLHKMIHRLPEGRLSCRKHREVWSWYEVTENVLSWEDDLHPYIAHHPPVDVKKMKTEEGNPRKKNSEWDIDISGEKGTDENTRGKKKRNYSYIRKADREKAEMLAYKELLIAILDDLEKEYRGILNYEKCLTKSVQAEQLMATGGVADLLRPLLSQNHIAAEDWATEKYEKNPDFPERLRIPTLAGFNVRSKSEALIANLLHAKQIPFRYECKLTFGRMVLYPDFTIMNPETGQILIWEHFGMLSENDYQNEYWSKIKIYIQAGYIPYKSLITTFETDSRPFDVNDAENMVNLFIGNGYTSDIPVIQKFLE